jgi:predicted alternative tryptophan synthase beta-subunit
MSLSEDELISEAGRRLAGAKVSPSTAGELDGGQLETMALPKGVSAVAMRIVRRTNKELHAMVCGEAESDQEDRRSILDAFHLGDDAFASALVAAGIGYCGLSPALSVVVAVILVKRIGRPAMQELCGAWGEALNG